MIGLIFPSDETTGGFLWPWWILPLWWLLLICLIPIFLILLAVKLLVWVLSILIFGRNTP